MKPEEFTEAKWGRLLKQPEGFWTFVPCPLPPRLELDWALVNQLAAAQRELARLDGLARNLANSHLLISPILRREAVLSSRIEGTQASLSDLFLFEAAGPAPGTPSDVHEVMNYVRALEYGLKRLDSLPISIRLMNELHEQLMRGVRGGHLTPGEFRRSQNWIGPPGCGLNDATYVPPPPHEMKDALGELEKFIHGQCELPALIRLALIHYQFEAIHPYLDGNGRIGRLLITLILCAERLLEQPLLYLSAFFEKRRQEYYGRLLAVSQHGQWSAWLKFFLEGVCEQSTDAIRRTERLLQLQREFSQKLKQARSSALPLKILDELFCRPFITIPQAARLLKVTTRTANLTVNKLVNAGILVEKTGRERNRIYVARAILKAVEGELT